MSPYLAELMGVMILIILGDGVVANVLLNKSKGPCLVHHHPGRRAHRLHQGRVGGRQRAAHALDHVPHPGAAQGELKRQGEDAAHFAKGDAAPSPAAHTPGSARAARRTS